MEEQTLKSKARTFRDFPTQRNIVAKRKHFDIVTFQSP